MTEFWFNPNIEASELKDSMQLDSGEVVAVLLKDGLLAELRVEGDVKVDFAGERYYHASDMPEEMIKAFADPESDVASRMNVLNNNWFETYVYKLIDPSLTMKDLQQFAVGKEYVDGDINESAPFALVDDYKKNLEDWITWAIENHPEIQNRKDL